MKKKTYYEPNLHEGDTPSYSFSFEDKKRENITYWATYYYPKESLEVTIHDIQTMEDGTVDKTETWDIFYVHATFKEILEAAVTPAPCYLEDEALEALEVIKNSENKDITLLGTIRDKPFILYELDIDLMGRFINILETARWSIDDKERTDAISLLRDHLLHGRNAGKHCLPPGFNKLAIVVMKKLADTLRDKLLEDLYKEDNMNLNITLEDYNSLKLLTTTEWQKLCSFIKGEFSTDIRISELSKVQIETLIKEPAKFLDDIVFSKDGLLGMTTETLAKHIKERNNPI